MRLSDCSVNLKTLKMEIDMPKCIKCGSSQVVNVNVSAHWDIPEREDICQKCGHHW